MSPRRVTALRVVALVIAGIAALDVAIIKLGGSDNAEAANTAKAVVAEIKPPSRQPQIKDAATKPTPEGATAFTLFWFDTLNYSLAHADTDLLVGWTSAGCRLCTGWLLGIGRWQADGSRLQGGLTYPANLAIGPFSTTKPVAFAATFLTSAAQVTAKNGKVQRYPGGRTQGGLSVLWANGRWQMTDIVLDAKQAEATPP